MSAFYAISFVMTGKLAEPGMAEWYHVNIEIKLIITFLSDVHYDRLNSNLKRNRNELIKQFFLMRTHFLSIVFWINIVKQKT